MLHANLHESKSMETDFLVRIICFEKKSGEFGRQNVERDGFLSF